MVDLEAVIAHRDRVLATIERECLRDKRVRALLLVGSLASGRSDLYSDIDVVLVAHDESAAALLADRLSFAPRVGELLVQLDSSWNVWSGAAQVVTLLNGELPLWVDIDIWTASAAGIPSDARLLAGRSLKPEPDTLSELTHRRKEALGPGHPATEPAPGAFDVARLAWRLNQSRESTQMVWARS